MKYPASVALFASLMLLLTAGVADARWKKGEWVNQSPYRNFGSSTLYYRPFSPDEKVRKVMDWRIDNLPLDHKGIEIGATRHSDGTAWAYRRIVIKHCHISDAWRTPGVHTDFIRIFGGGSAKQDVPTNVVLDDIYIHDGNALPIIIQDGHFRKIILKHIRYERVHNSIQLVTINSGLMEEIHILHSPGLRVSLCGRPGSIRKVYVKNSPGAVVVDASTINGRSGASIEYLD